MIRVSVFRNRTYIHKHANTTKLVMKLKHLKYKKRLERLKLPTLRYRRTRGDMIEVYKILTESYCKSVNVELELHKKSVTGTSIKWSHSSSGGLVSSPLLAAAIFGPKLGVRLSPASPHSPNCPRRQGREPPSGRPQTPPALSLRGNGFEDLGGPPSRGRVRKDDFPPLVGPVADEEGFTSVAVVGGLSDPNCVRSSDVARGLIWGPYGLVWDRSSIPADT